MKKPYFSKIVLSLLAGVCLAAGPALAAESLAGKVGNKRSSVYFPQGMEGGCEKAYKAYVAAAGHSAYASTMNGPGIYNFVCGARVNVGSQAAAEKAAVSDCEAGRKKYKVKFIGGCKIVASK
ncbi:hypothetical protein RB623_23030 [Mesorhizobium sp. LHD-90]|uniref:hypothetical protein n=1 Tax=Mesorhizobium sp. LHD-90 TaxID=3071414 RepID=UPI0027DFB5A9|nr:hypothetical protein [Mesorhizobium sp. LHD-90]MDQ6436935.1 hypothetical protein [Mesorhizobium sp. LHD-90]